MERSGTLVITITFHCLNDDQEGVVIVDDVGNTAGDIALSLNDAESYRLIRDAGLRSGKDVL
jgi:hypothetical protein